MATSEDVFVTLRSLEQRLATLEKLVAASFRSEQDNNSEGAIQASRKAISVATGVVLWDWIQNDLDRELLALLQGLESPSSFKQEALCSALITGQLIEDTAQKIQEAPHLQPHWDLVTLYPLAVGRLPPMLAPSLVTNGHRVIYERLYYHVYNRARVLAAKLTGTTSLEDDNVINLTSPGSVQKAPKSTPIAARPSTSNKPDVIVIDDSDEEELERNGPSMPASLPVGKLERVTSTSVIPLGPRFPVPQGEPKTPRVKEETNKRSPVSPVHQVGESPPLKSKPKRQRFRNSEVKRVLFKEEAKPAEKRNWEPTESFLEGLQQEDSSPERVKPATKMEPAVKKESVARKEPVAKKEPLTTEPASTQVQMTSLLQSFMAFSPSESQLKAVNYQFTAEKELSKALLPLRTLLTTPSDVFVALATTIKERRANAPVVQLSERGTPDTRKKLAAFSSRYYPGLTIVKGIPNVLVNYKLSFDVTILFGTSRLLVDLENGWWSRLVNTLALLWTSLNDMEYVLRTLDDANIALTEESGDLATVFASLEPAAWDDLLEFVLFDLAKTSALEKPKVMPKASDQVMRWLLHPYSWAPSRKVKSGVVLPALSVAPHLTTPKQASLKTSLLLWAIFPQPCEIPSIVAYMVALYLGIEVDALDMKPAVTSPLWKVFGSEIRG